MPQELPAAAGVEDAITRFDAARDAFAAELRDLHIRCGKPKQSMLVEAAARTAAEKNNDKFRLHPGTLSDVLRGKKTPTYDFLSALIRQLVMAQPGVGEYKQLWAQWDQRWQDLMRLKPQTDARRKGASGPAREEAEPANAAIDGEAARIIAEAHQQAEAIRDAARAEAAAIIAQAHEQAAAHAAHTAADSDAEANQARAKGGQLAITPQPPVSPSARPQRGSSGEERPGDSWLRSHGKAVGSTGRRPGDLANDVAAANGGTLFDVAVYRWGSGRSWGTGMGPAAHSMPEDQAAELQRRLGPMLRVDQQYLDSLRRPGRSSWTEPSLVRAVFADVATVVHRMPRVDGVGRPSTVSCVLNGSPSALTASRAILLDCPSSTWLETVSGTIQPWTHEQLASEIQHNHSRFLGEIPRVRRVGSGRGTADQDAASACVLPGADG
ncbi:hypothetical protein ACFWJM_05940 [Streptomyces sp. NPDC127077]|uniref:hypothetical protein n=1 Tax=Streptomyces sp. NPDC127077 TaxID=3347131 RepID=UPI0036489B7C